MTLREAVDRAEESFWGHIEGMWSEDEVEDFRLVIDTARQHMDDTAEIVLPCATCRGKWRSGTPVGLADGRVVGGRQPVPDVLQDAGSFPRSRMKCHATSTHAAGGGRSLGDGAAVP